MSIQEKIKTTRRFRRKRTSKVLRFIDDTAKDMLWSRDHPESKRRRPYNWIPKEYDIRYKIGPQMNFDSLDTLSLISDIEDRFKVDLGAEYNFEGVAQYYNLSLWNIAKITKDKIREKNN